MGSGMALVERVEALTEARCVERAFVRRAEACTKMRMGSGVALAERTKFSAEAMHVEMRMGSGVAPPEHAEALAEARCVERALARRAEAHTEREDRL